MDGLFLGLFYITILHCRIRYDNITFILHTASSINSTFFPSTNSAHYGINRISLNLFPSLLAIPFALINTKWWGNWNVFLQRALKRALLYRVMRFSCWSCILSKSDYVALCHYFLDTRNTRFTSFAKTFRPIGQCAI